MLRHVASWGDRIPHGAITIARRRPVKETSRVLSGDRASSAPEWLSTLAEGVLTAPSDVLKEMSIESGERRSLPVAFNPKNEGADNRRYCRSGLGPLPMP